MRHIRELIALTKAAYPRDDFFAGVEESLKIMPGARAHYRAYERAINALDSESWKVLREKAIAHFTDHRIGQRKQGFFNQLNDAFAYRYLVRKGYRHVRVLPESGATQPDIEYMDGLAKRFCEVKTIGISEEVIARRAKAQFTSSSIYQDLSTGFLNKLESTLSAAELQIKARRGRGLIYLLIHFDDITLDYYDRYRKRISNCLQAHSPESIYIKIGLTGQRHIQKAARPS